MSRGVPNFEEPETRLLSVAFISVTGGLGGPSRSLLTLMHHLAGSVERTLVSPAGRFTELVNERQSADHFVQLPRWRRLPRLSRVVAAITIAHWVQRNRRRRPILHVNGQSELNLAAPAAFLYQIPVVLWAHASEPSPSAHVFGRVWRGMLEHTTWTAVSEVAKSALAESRLIGPDTDVEIIPNPISEDDVVARGREGGTRSGPTTVGYFGGKAPAAGFEFVPDVIQSVSATAVRWLLFTSPPGPRATADQIRTWSRLEPLTGDRVEIRGKVPDVRAAYAECDIVFCPSIRESFGRVAAEAMLNGIPVVGSNIVPFDSLIGHRRAGLLFPVGDVDAAAKSLIELAGDPDLRGQLGREGRTRAQAFDPEQVGSRFAHVYSKAGL